METSFFDVNTLLNNLDAFDKAIANSAASMKACFDAKIAGISKSFEAAFQAADAMAANSADNFGQMFAWLICFWRTRMEKSVKPPAAKALRQGVWVV